MTNNNAVPKPLEKLKPWLRWAVRDTNGVVGIEALITFIALVIVMVSALTWFDALSKRTVAYKATYALADAISRESVPLNEDYLKDLNAMIRWWVGDPNSQLRVSLIKCRDRCDEFDQRDLEVCWSWHHSGGITGGFGADGSDGLTQEQLIELNESIFIFPKTDALLIVESRVSFNPLFDIGFPAMTFDALAVNRPRYVIEMPFDRVPGSNSTNTLRFVECF